MEISCLTNLTAFYNEITSLVGEGGEADIVYLDFRKAFSTVYRNILIDKLMKFGPDKRAVNVAELLVSKVYGQRQEV